MCVSVEVFVGSLGLVWVYWFKVSYLEQDLGNFMYCTS